MLAVLLVLALSVAASVSSMAARALCAIRQTMDAAGWHQHWLQWEGDEHCDSAYAPAHVPSSAGASAWKNGGGGGGGAGSSGSFLSSAPPELDTLVWLKLLFLPLLGMLVLLCFLLEECATHASTAHALHAQTAAALAPGTVPATAGGGGTFGWLRSWCARAPRITTAYQAQLQANTAALVLAQQQHAMHAHMAHMSLHHGAAGAMQGTSGLCCGCSGGGAGPGAAGKKLQTSQPSSSLSPSAASSSSLLSESASPATTPLSLNFSGFNHLSGSGPTLLYYHTAFQREAAPTASAAPSSLPAAEGKALQSNGKQHASNGKKGKHHGNGKHSSPPTTPKLLPAASSTVASPSSQLSSSSSASPPLPPASEFVPLRLVNESTGFNMVLSLWRGLTFAEILAWYVATHWREERGKYEWIEGGGSLSRSGSDEGAAPPAGSSSSASEEDELSAAILEPRKSSSQALAPPLMLCFQGVRISPLLTPQAVFPPPPSPPSPAPSAAVAVEGGTHSTGAEGDSDFPAAADGVSTSDPDAKVSRSPSSPAAGSSTSAASSSSAASSASAAAVSVDPPTLEIHVDFLLLFTRTRQKHERLAARVSSRARSNREAHASLLLEVAKTESEIEALAKSVREAEDRSSLLSNEVKRVEKDSERINRELTSTIAARKDLQESMAGSVGLVSNARARAEAEYKSLRVELDSLLQEQQGQKASYQLSLTKRHEASLALKHALIISDSHLKRLNALKVIRIKRDKVQEKIKKLEAQLGGPVVPQGTPATAAAAEGAAAAATAATTTSEGGSTPPGAASSSSAVSSAASTSTSAASTSSTGAVANGAVALRLRYAALENEHNILNVRLNELRSLSHDIDDACKNESYKLRYRLKALDKDLRDLGKWKSLARAHESDARDAVRWKALLKQTKAREKILEREAREQLAWRARARMMEKEVRELRAWRGAMDQGAAGTAGEVPAFARDGGAGAGDVLLLGADSALALAAHRRASSNTSSLGGTQHSAAVGDEFVSRTGTPPDMESSFAATLAAYHQQQQQQHHHLQQHHQPLVGGFSALRGGPVHASAGRMHASSDPEQRAGAGGSSSLHSEFTSGSSGPYDALQADAASSFAHFGATQQSWGAYGAGAGVDVAASATGVSSVAGADQQVDGLGVMDDSSELLQEHDADGDFGHDHPALSFLAE